MNEPDGIELIVGVLRDHYRDKGYEVHHAHHLRWFLSFPRPDGECGLGISFYGAEAEAMVMLSRFKPNSNVERSSTVLRVPLADPKLLDKIDALLAEAVVPRDRYPRDRYANVPCQITGVTT